MSPASILYTDPAWAIDPTGQLDPARADIEAGIFGQSASIRFGPRREGQFVRTGDELLRAVKGVDALVIYRTEITPSLIEALKPTCRVVARQGVGFDNLNAPLLEAANIFAFNVPDYCVDEVSTHAMALVLALERQVVTQDRLVKCDRWNIFGGGVPRRLVNSTFGIVGFGRIGRATCRKAQVFYNRVVAYDPYVQGDLMAGHGVTKVDRLEDFLMQSDVVVLHTALTPETKGMFGSQTLRHMKKEAYLVNVARGALVCSESVLAALRAGQIGGFASDVFTPEDPNVNADSKALLEFDNVVVSSHRAFLSIEAERSQRVRVAETIMQVLQDASPPRFGRLA